MKRTSISDKKQQLFCGLQEDEELQKNERKKKGEQCSNSIEQWKTVQNWSNIISKLWKKITQKHLFKQIFLFLAHFLCWKIAHKILPTAYKDKANKWFLFLCQPKKTSLILQKNLMLLALKWYRHLCVSFFLLFFFPLLVISVNSKTWPCGSGDIMVSVARLCSLTGFPVVCRKKTMSRVQGF